MAKTIIKRMTPKFRVSFPHVFEPHAMSAKQKPKFSITMLFPKDTDMAWYKSAVQECLTDKFGSDSAKWPKGLRKPLRDGDEKEADVSGYAGQFFMTARAQADRKPGIVDQSGVVRIESPDEFYAGCYAKATVVFYYYDTEGNKGVGVALNNIMKLADGEKFSGRKSAEDDFGPAPGAAASDVDADDVMPAKRSAAPATGAASSLLD